MYTNQLFHHQKEASRAFPGGPLVKTLSLDCRGAGLTPGGGTKTPHVDWSEKKANSIYYIIKPGMREKEESGTTEG